MFPFCAVFRAIWKGADDPRRVGIGSSNVPTCASLLADAADTLRSSTLFYSRSPEQSFVLFFQPFSPSRFSSLVVSFVASVSFSVFVALRCCKTTDSHTADNGCLVPSLLHVIFLCSVCIFVCLCVLVILCCFVLNQLSSV